MKKILFVGISALLLAGCGDHQKETSGEVEDNKTEETVETKGPTQDELNVKLKEEAVEADYKELNSDNAPDKKKVFVKGEIGAVFEEGILGTFILNNENGIYTVNLLSVDEKYETGDNVTVYGTTNGKDETGIPQISATILEHNEEKTEAQTPTVDKPEVNEEKVVLNRDEEIEETANKIIEQNYNQTTVNKITVNENLGLNDGSYIVLPYLKWDAMNNSKRTKRLIEMYSDDLAANLAKEGDISEITVFWEVPYHLEGKNVAKFTYTKNGDSMSIGERWYDPSLKE